MNALSNVTYDDYRQAIPVDVLPGLMGSSKPASKTAGPMPDFAMPPISGLPRIHPGDNLSIGDAANYAGNIASRLWDDFGELQPQVADIYRRIFAGDLPGVGEQLLAPQLAQIATAIPHAQRQAQDSLSGGALAEALSNIAQQGVAQRAGAFGNLLPSLLSGAMEMGSNVAQRTITPLLGAGGLRVSQRAASNGGKK